MWCAIVTQSTSQQSVLTDNHADVPTFLGIAGWFENTTSTTSEGVCARGDNIIRPGWAVLPLDLTGERLCYVNAADPNGNYVHWLGPGPDKHSIIYVYTVAWPSLPFPKFAEQGHLSRRRNLVARFVDTKCHFTIYTPLALLRK